MRRSLAVSLLLASFVVVSQTAPANFTPEISDIIELQVHSTADEQADRSQALEPHIDSSSGTRPAETIAPDPQNELVRPSFLDRAKLALARSEARPPSREEICTALVAVARQNNLPLGFFTNLIWQESRFNHEAVSRAGAMGIAQFMPDVAEALSIDAFEARDALPASGKLLNDLRARFGSLGLVAAAYNAGPKRVSDWLAGRRQLPAETHDYVSIITGHRAERWREKAPLAVYQVPLQIPCHKIQAFAAVERSERIMQLEAVAQERRAIAAAAAQAAALQREALARSKKNAARSGTSAKKHRSRMAQAR
jgi:hypothetical protein